MANRSTPSLVGTAVALPDGAVAVEPGAEPLPGAAVGAPSKPIEASLVAAGSTPGSPDPPLLAWKIAKNPMAATAGRISIAEVEELVEVGELDPESVHTPGVFVQRMIVAPREKRIERRTVSKA